MSICVIDSPIGHLRLTEESGAITAVTTTSEALISPANPILSECARQLAEYFRGELRDFSLPLAPAGTIFQQRVWQALQCIPYGETRSYGDIAKAIGQPKASRAIGGANHRNPILIIIPCHRVIGAGGALVGYGAGLDIKAYLLNHERKREGA